MQKIITFFDNLLDESTPAKPAWNIEHILENIAPKWNYIDGCMIKAVLDMYYATKNDRYLAFAKNFIDFYVNEKGEILGYKVDEYNCDNVNEGKVLFDLYKLCKEDKYKKAIELIYSQVVTHPRIKAGNFWHKKIYPNQVWLDGLYMVQPFFMEYEMTFNNKANYKDIFAQFKNVQDIMRDNTTGLFYHGYDESRQMFWADKTTGLSKNFWTRSMGWYAMALVDTLEKLDEQFFYEYETLQSYFKALLDALQKFQDPDTKLYYQVTNMGGKEGNYLETSGSCAIAYSLMKGARLGYLPIYYYDHGKEIFDAIVEHKLEPEQFILKDICLVAGLGGMPGKGSYKERDGTYEYYISEPKVNNDAKGVAPFLFAYTEVLRKEQGNENRG
ncbi:MAG: glycoside hydrolase family 88 protein [Defluviitaleaceae bacterium]|nr:glycoside hydrolase family 88 protein [Defluviitaleaceae bacterium]